MRVLGLDPGEKNFAWAFLLDAVLEAHDYLRPVEDDDFKAFGRRFIELLELYHPDVVVFERFMIRGKDGGGRATIAEPVNLMLGYIMHICDERDIPWHRITASQWKVHYNKIGRPDVGLKSHEQDAACIGHYYETYWHERSKVVVAMKAAKQAKEALMPKKSKSKKRRKKKAEQPSCEL